jgi:hypothetical protein
VRRRENAVRVALIALGVAIGWSLQPRAGAEDKKTPKTAKEAADGLSEAVKKKDEKAFQDLVADKDAFSAIVKRFDAYKGEEHKQDEIDEQFKKFQEDTKKDWTELQAMGELKFLDAAQCAFGVTKGEDKTLINIYVFENGGRWFVVPDVAKR